MEMSKLKKANEGHEQTFTADGFTEIEMTRRISSL